MLFILHLPPPVHGSSLVGSQIFKSESINAEYEARFVNLNTSDSLVDIGKYRLKKFLKYWFIFFGILTELISKRPDLVYMGITARGVAFYKDALLVLLCKIFGMPMVYHFNNKGVKSAENNYFYRFFYKMVFRNSRAIVLSKTLYKDISTFFLEETIEVCPYGVQDEAGPGIVEYRAESASNPCRNTILYLGNLIKTKGCLTLIDACKQLQIRGIDFRCLLVGGEGDINEIELNEEIMRLNLQSHVFYLGRKLGKEKKKVFLESDIFAFPTFYPFEALPIVNIEAMQWGLPIVSTFEGGIPDEVINNETGFLVTQKDVCALADKLEKLLINRDLRVKMSLAGRARYLQYYTYDTFENRIIGILNKALGGDDHN